MESVYILGKYAPALSCQKSSKKINTILIFIHYVLRWIQETIGFVLHKKEKREHRNPGSAPAQPQQHIISIIEVKRCLC